MGNGGGAGQWRRGGGEGQWRIGEGEDGFLRSLSPVANPSAGSRQGPPD